jgi:hypothetical protein
MKNYFRSSSMEKRFGNTALNAEPSLRVSENKILICMLGLSKRGMEYRENYTLKSFIY